MNANEQIVLVGDFNAFEFNDGLGDSMGTIAGLPSPDNTTAVIGDGADLVNPDFDNLFDSVPALQRYSYTFDGMAQSIDHALVSAAVAVRTTAPRIEHANINADFPETERNNAASPNRLSDHDPLVVFLTPNVFIPIDVSLTKTASTATPVAGGSNFSYTVTVTNAGPQPAANVVWNDTLPTAVRFVSMANVAGWTCTTPAAGSSGAISCSNPSQAVGSAVFTVVANLAASTPAAAIANTATVTTTSIDSNPANNSATANQTITVDANLSILLTDSPDPVSAGSQLTYVATLTNVGPSEAQGASIALPLPATLTFVSAVASAGGACVTPAVGANGTVTCTWAGVTLPAAQRSVTVIAGVPAATASGSILNAIATASSGSPDSVPGNNTATTATAVNVAADLSITLTDTPDPVTAGTNLSYLATLSNGGPSDAQDVTISLPLDAGTSFVSATPSAGGSCNAASPVVCTWAGATLPAGTRSVTVVAAVAAAQTAGLSATATASSLTPDPAAGNNTATATTVVQVQADLAITLTDAPDPVVAGTQLTYTAVVSNAGPSDATAVVVTLPTPSNTSFVSGSVTGGGACAGSPVVCTVTGSMAPGASRTTSIVMLVAASAPEASVINATATVTSGSPDPNAGNNSASTTTTVNTLADLVLTLTATTSQIQINVPVSFTATSQNLGPSDAQGVSITLTLTPDFRYAGHTAAGATCTTPQVGNTGAIVCTWAGATAPGVTRTLVVNAFSNVEGQTAVNASTTSSTTDPVANNNAAGLTVQVGYLVEEIPTLSGLGLILMGLLFGLIGFVAVRREA
ncbi:MAG: IPTL-CTERM sorting domain-containing protein [Rhodanobacteraceae bacterium]|nr:IPTL-CTERM sorting domain-containing protein [Rhodanobacteraceae bacterium]